MKRSDDLRTGREGADTMAQVSVAGRLDSFVTEACWLRGAVLLLVLAVTGLFGGLFAAHWVPVHGGVDQNGYLVGGKMLARTGTMALQPVRPVSGDLDPYQFVGRMWIGADLGTEHERYYPKYPLGLPALVAVCLWVGGSDWGPWLTYWISPVGMTLSILAVFLLARQLVGSVGGLLAATILASSPVTMGLANNPNSHGATLACVTWGMYLLVSWWRSPTYWRAILAGLLLGYATTIRYTEGLLILPILLVILFNFRWRQRQSYCQSAAMLAAWVLPIAILITYNLRAFGSVTGYDPTNESSGFAWAYFVDNWFTMLRQLDATGLFLLFPFAIAGLIGMFWWEWRVAAVMAAWILPGVATYTFYYWAPENSAIGYMRFFLTILPAMAICAFWVIGWFGQALVAAHGSTWRWRLIGPLTAGSLAVLALLVNLETALPTMHRDQVNRLALQDGVRQIQAVVPTDAVILSTDNGLMHHLQFVGDYLLYSPSQFNAGFLRTLLVQNPDDPQAFQVQRRQIIHARLKDLNQRALHEEQQGIVAVAHEAGLRVFVQVQPRTERNLRRSLDESRFEIVPVAYWNNPNLAALWADLDGPPRQPRRRTTLAPPRYDRNRMTWQLLEVRSRESEPASPDAPARRPLAEASR